MPETSVVSQVELAGIRRESQKFMPDTIRVHPRTAGRTASGGTTYTVATNPTATVQGRLAPMGEEEEQFYADRLGERQGWTITVPYGTVVGNNAQMKVGSRTFEVVGSDTPRSYQITQRYACKELF